MKMSDIKIIGYGAEYADGMIVANKLTAGGTAEATYYWIDYSEEGEGSWYGWYDIDGETDFNNAELAPGEGLWISATGENIAIQCAGAVPGSSVSVTLRQGNKLVSNPMPVELEMGTITIDGYGAEYADGMIVANKLTAGGTAEATYYWIDYSEEGEGSWYGWYDIDGETDYNNEKLPAGEALWISATSSDISITFPSPLAK